MEQGVHSAGRPGMLRDGAYPPRAREPHDDA
jgi:hypothetical protein